MTLSGTVALITGAGSGIGQAIAYKFAEAGADIAVNDIELSKTSETCSVIEKKLGRKAIPAIADISDEKSVDSMVDLVLRELNKIDILVNNAGVVDQLRTPTIEQSVTVFDRVLAIHFKGAYLCCRSVGKHMIKQGSGNIINIASIHAFNPMTKRTAYGPAKAAVVNLTKQLAVEWAPNNIRVNSIAPGFVYTQMAKDAFEKGLSVMEDLLKPVPMKRMAKPDEIANVALFLASEESSYITGITVPVDGGWLANRD